MTPPTVRCERCGHEFARDEAAGAFFDGEKALYRCERCLRWTRGPSPDGQASDEG